MASPVPPRPLRALLVAVLTVALCLLGTVAPRSAQALDEVIEVDDAVTEGDPRFEYAGDWTSGSGLPADWFDGTEHYTAEPGASVTLHFSGTRAELFGSLHPNQGIYQISVDGAVVAEVDGYAASHTHRQRLADTGVLEPGEHTLTMTLTGRQNPEAGGAAGQVDFAAVTTGEELEPGWQSLPQPNRIALAEGGWVPDQDTRVVALTPELAEEARRLAAELAEVSELDRPEVVTGGEPREGDVVLVTGEVEGSSSPEAYAIEVAGTVRVTAPSATGTFRGTRGLLHNLRTQQLVPHGEVAGWPAVAERALHLDAARKYFSADWIKTELHDMSYVGLNTLQLHFSENEGFRVESERYPEVVSEDGALSKAEVREILALAEELHIEVIPSLVMPGHLEQVLLAYPQLRLFDADGQPVHGAVDFTIPEAEELLLGLIEEYAELFPDATHWNIGADEFVDFENIERYPSLQQAAVEQFGPEATAFDLYTDFVNRMAEVVEGEGYVPRVWNDGMLRSDVVSLDPDVQINWWTNWSPQMARLAVAREGGYDLLNYNDSLFYYVLGENAGYRYPTSARIWEADWHPGVFPSYSDDGVTRPQVIEQPYPEELLGASFAVWSDRPEAQTQEQVSQGLRQPLRAMAERSWSAGSELDLRTFNRIADEIGRAPVPAGDEEEPGGQAPSVTIEAPGAATSGWHLTAPLVTVSATDPDDEVVDVEISLDGETWRTYPGPFRAPEGVTTVRARATDEAGNVSEPVSLTISVDTVAPVVHSRLLDGGERLRLAASDTGSGVAAVEYRIGTGAWRPYTTPVAITGAAQVHMRATDVAGHRSGVFSRTVPTPGAGTVQLSSSVVTQCQDGRAVVAVHVRNGAEQPVSLRLRVGRQTVRVDDLAPGAATYHRLPTGATELTAGTVTVAAWVPGRDRSSTTYRVPHGAQDCG